MADLLIILVLLAILGGAGWYVYRAKKAGKKCIGCPAGRNCSTSACGGHCASCGGCANQTNQTTPNNG